MIMDFKKDNPPENAAEIHLYNVLSFDYKKQKILKVPTFKSMSILFKSQIVNQDP